MARERDDGEHDPLEEVPFFVRRVELEDDQLANLEKARFGEVTVVTANWGTFRDTEGLIADYEGLFGRLDAKRRGMLTQTGFTGGWRYAETTNIASDEIQDRHARQAAALVKAAFKERGWKGATLLTVGSASSRRDVAEQTQQFLRDEGITIDHAMFYGLACASASEAVVDMAGSKTLEGQPVVAVGVESLSGSLVSRDDLELQAVFGNGGGAVAFIPGREIEHVAGTTRVKKDKSMIQLPSPHIYYVPPVDQQLPHSKWPARYSFHDDDARTVFSISPHGVMMNMPENPELRFSRMYGGATLKYFVREGVDHGEQFFADYPDEAFGYALGHQPSHPVVQGFNNRWGRLRAKSLEGQGRRLPAIEIPWLMGETGINNVSAATSLVQMREHIRKGYLQEGRLTPMIGMGIGAVTHMDLLRFHR